MNKLILLTLSFVLILTKISNANRPYYPGHGSGGSFFEGVLYVGGFWFVLWLIFFSWRK